MATAAEFDIDAELEAERLAEQERLLRLQQELAALDQPAPRVESESLGRYYGPMAGEPMARSFINANTSALGETIEAGRNDDVIDPRAIRMQGQNEFNSLVSGGMNPAEALAKTAGKIYYNDPQSMMRAVQPRSRITQPRVAAAPKIAPPKMPQGNADERKLINDQLRKIQSDDLADQSQLEKLRSRYMELGTNWMPQAQSAPPAPFAMKTTDISTPDGLEMRQLPVARTSAPTQQSTESPESIRNLYRSGKLSKAEAAARLRKLGFD